MSPARCGWAFACSGAHPRPFFLAARQKLDLDSACQLILPLGGDEGVFAGHLQIAVAGNLRRFDGATADLLPPRDVRAPE